MVRFVAGLAVDTVGGEDRRARAARADPRRPARRVRRVGPGGRAARPRLPPRDAALPRGAPGSAAWRGGSSAASTTAWSPAWSSPRVQDHVIAAARSHVERLVLEAFVEQTRAMEEGEEKVAGHPAVRPVRAEHDRGRPGVVPRARPALGPALQGDQPRVSARCAARSGPWPTRSSTASGSRPRCCALPRWSTPTRPRPERAGPHDGAGGCCCRDGPTRTPPRCSRARPPGARGPRVGARAGGLGPPRSPARAVAAGRSGGDPVRRGCARGRSTTRAGCRPSWSASPLGTRASAYAAQRSWPAVWLTPLLDDEACVAGHPGPTRHRSCWSAVCGTTSGTPGSPATCATRGPG